jgi:hypothetical protein
MAPPLFNATISADGKTVTITPSIDVSVSVDVTWLGQKQTVAFAPTAPILGNDSDGKSWTVSAQAADGSYTATRN